MHTRFSKKSSPLLFDSEIEKTARQNRVLLRSAVKAKAQSSTVAQDLEQAANEMADQEPQNQAPQNEPIPPIPDPSIPQNQNQPNNQNQNQPPPQPFPQFNPGPRNQPTNLNLQHGDIIRLNQPPHQHGYDEGFQHREGSVHTWESGWEEDDYQNQYDGRYADYRYDEGYNVNQGHPVQQQVNQRNHIQRPIPQNQIHNGVPQFNEGRANNRFRGDQIQFVDGVPQVVQGAPIQGVEGHCRPVVVPNSSAIVTPVGNNNRPFEVRPQYLGHLPEFYGKRTKEPYLHIASFDSICQTIGVSGFTKDEVKLMLFQFTLKDKARHWFTTLPPCSIYTWQEMQLVFLEEYYTMNRTSEARDAIRAFQQHSGEPFHEAFTRFKELLRKCPHHEIQTWELIKVFYDGLLPDDVRDLIAISNGTFLTNTEAADWAYLERQSATSKRQTQSSRKARSSSAKSVDYEAEERVEKLRHQNLLLERQVAQMKLGKGAVVKTANTFSVCTECGELGHQVGECAVLGGQTDEVNQIYGERKQYDMKLNTYHPGLQNHPNFNYGNFANQMNPNFQVPMQGGQQYQSRQGNYLQGNYQNQGPYNPGTQQGNSSSASGGTSDDKLDAIMKFMKDVQKENEVRDKTSEAMQKQLGQLAEDLAQLRRDPGKLPSTTTVNPAHQSSSLKNGRNVHINAVSILPTSEFGSVTITPPSQLVEEVVEDVGNRSDSQHDRDPPRDERWESFKQAKINLPLLDAIKESPDQVEFLKELSTQKQLHKFPKKLDLTANVNAVLLGTLPPKLQDPGAPIISVQVGEFKIERALLDLGACVSILPGSLYDQYDFGPLQKVNTTVVLADQTPMCPRGIVRDVIMKVEECYYPVDFLVLDCATSSKNTQPPVILGRPFLATAHAIINCVDGTVSEHSKAESGEESVSPAKEIHTKHECFMVDRFEVAGNKAVRKKESVAHEEFKIDKGKPRGKKKKKKPPEVNNAKRRLKLFGPMWNTVDDLLEHWRGTYLEAMGCKQPTRPP
ncbi:putative transcription factor interactor and regulator CCHC(Zn) family [Helianthus annuus]|nr:putative transcription factor interactor and regulator CCHC(Zn) family [Helianthus annuus]KAJ0497282.1 putative transcription factor interactor and regulator CCHC(Zn) family [Helianthus annuus]KAJ0663291.1 putative transcription factor interactor and regulator CCHC(Zn) family [Helianthus annuus]KAJ0857709.1 putative transcription factor interactor and regulator CCHC(Zn) family [Helianthus annuus]